MAFNLILIPYLDFLTTIMIIIFWDFFMFDQTFLSPQLEWTVIISNKYGIYELPDNLANDIGLRVLGNQEISEISKSRKIIA